MKKTTAIIILATTGLNPVMAADENSKNALSYSFIEGAYLHDNFNANGVEVRDDTAPDLSIGSISDHAGGGFAARVSYDFSPRSKTIGFHIVSDFYQSNHSPVIDITGPGGAAIAVGIVDTSQKELRLAMGIHTRVSDSISWFAEAGLVRNKAILAQATGIFSGGGPITTDLSFFSGLKTSFDFKAGMRAMATKNIEVTGYGRYHGNGKIVSGDDGKVNFSSEVKAGAGAYYHFSDSFQLGGDYEFGRPGRLRLVARLSF